MKPCGCPIGQVVGTGPMPTYLSLAVREEARVLSLHAISIRKRYVVPFVSILLTSDLAESESRRRRSESAWPFYDTASGLQSAPRSITLQTMDRVLWCVVHVA